MRKTFAAVAVTSLISLASGCTLVGAGIGASASRPEHRAGPIATGVLAGLAVDAALVGLALSNMDLDLNIDFDFTPDDGRR